jgi:hypothetical protein
MKTRLTFLSAISALVTSRFITNTVWVTEQVIQQIVSNTIIRPLPASVISLNG